ncbi:hypothetical protein [Brucella intermedia]|uniref:hypothetical protein n=1 Tax=Brucella intermedia TaxID=94625 RepID=UPI00244EB68C|nr:hypothetical protein [Brucella intermedia]WGJ06611.1 hypothetical protein QBQ48_12235 [Brucella intermedia]
MNEVHLHYTQYPSGYVAVSCIGLTPEQLRHYAQPAGFLFITAENETQRFVSRRMHSRLRLFTALENAGHEVSTSAADHDIVPPMPLIDPSYYDDDMAGGAA